jgi:hypothetical protein
VVVDVDVDVDVDVGVDVVQKVEYQRITGHWTNHASSNTDTHLQTQCQRRGGSS